MASNRVEGALSNWDRVVCCSVDSEKDFHLPIWDCDLFAAPWARTTRSPERSAKPGLQRSDSALTILALGFSLAGHYMFICPWSWDSNRSDVRRPFHTTCVFGPFSADTTRIRVCLTTLISEAEASRQWLWLYDRRMGVVVTGMACGRMQEACLVCMGENTSATIGRLQQPFPPHGAMFQGRRRGPNCGRVWLLLVDGAYSPVSIASSEFRLFNFARLLFPPWRPGSVVLLGVVRSGDGKLAAGYCTDLMSGSGRSKAVNLRPAVAPPTTQRASAPTLTRISASCHSCVHNAMLTPSWRLSRSLPSFRSKKKTISWPCRQLLLQRNP
jgi:hypothetical protein